MVEARIQCQCPSYVLSDLGLHLHQGDVVWVSPDKISASVELRFARSIGAVSVSYVQRCQVYRAPPPPTVRLKRRTTPPAQATAPAPAPSMDSTALEDAVARGVAKAVAELVSSGILIPGPRVDPVVVPSRTGAPTPVFTATMNEPVYIPSNLVPTDASTTINVSSTESEGTDLDEASAALKASRRKKKV